MPERLHVLEVVGNAIVGGMESYVERLVERLPRDRFEISALCPFESPFTRKLRAAGCRILIAPVTDDPRWSTLQLAATFVAHYGIQVMHAHLSNAHALACLAGALTGVPALATIHGRALPMLDLEIYRMGQTQLSVVCQNAYLHALGLGVREEDVHLIPNGVDCATFQPAPERGTLQNLLGLAPGTPLVGFVGRLAPEKGPEVFVRMAWLTQRSLPEVHFVLIGDGPQRASVEAGVKSAGLADRVHFAGVQHDLPPLYASLDLYVASSHTEGMPLALLEAMAMGIPAVVSEVGGMTEIVEHGVSGVLVPPREPERLARAVEALMGAPERRTSMGVAARERVQSKFALDASVAAMGDLLSYVAVSRPRTCDGGAGVAAARTAVPTRADRLALEQSQRV